MPDPTEEEIAAHCKAIQATHSPAVQRARQTRSRAKHAAGGKGAAMLVRLYGPGQLIAFNDRAAKLGVSQQALAHAAIEAAINGDIKVGRPIRPRKRRTK